jgi:hypothetical protein
VGFELAKYDASRPLYIDPLIYSTYLGGSGGDYGLASPWTVRAMLTVLAGKVGGGGIASDAFWVSDSAMTASWLAMEWG